MDLQEVGWGMDSIDLVEDTESWRALVNVVMILLDLRNARNFLTTWYLLVSQERLCSIELVSYSVS